MLAGLRTMRMKRLVVVADNRWIVAAIRSGVRVSEDLQLLGYVDHQAATAARIAHAGAEVVLVDESDHPELAVALIRALRERDEEIIVIVLTRRMEGEWLSSAFEAGANGAMSKSIHPAALATLLREAVSGHIVHAPISPHATRRNPTPSHSSLTDREREILSLVASGATNSDIARRLWITQQTVKFHVSNLYRKLDVTNRTEACHYAHLNGFVELGEPAASRAPQSTVTALAS